MHYYYYDPYTQLNKLAKINLNILTEEIWEDAKSKWPWTYLVYAIYLAQKISVLGLFILMEIVTNFTRKLRKVII